MPSDPYPHTLNAKISEQAHKGVTKVERHFQDEGYGRCKKKVVDALLCLVTGQEDVIDKVTGFLEGKDRSEETG
jgi:hypothetical protein